MQTELLSGPDEVVRAAELICNGGLVAVPTETVYGLCADGLNAKAVENIYEVKGRPEQKPLSLMVAGSDSFEKLCLNIPKQAYVLAEKFWPGPLTIVLKSNDLVPEIVRAGGETVGLRCPAHTATLELLRKCDTPLAGPSANPSGKKSPKNADTVLEYFSGKIDAVLDGGVCAVGIESTIIDLSETPYRILREGALSIELIKKALRENMTVIGVTGGSGCGKTTAMAVLQEMGALHLDCDKIYHRLTSESTELRKALTDTFGDVYDGIMLDRKKLGSIVFTDNIKLQQLNAITHHFVKTEVIRLLNEHAMNGGTLAAIDAIGLFDGELTDECDITLSVWADEETRIQRIMLRDSISREYAINRIRSQHDRAYFESRSDYVLENNSSPEFFLDKCRSLFQKIIPQER